MAADVRQLQWSSPAGDEVRRMVLLCLLLVACTDDAGTGKKSIGGGTYHWNDPDYRVICWTRGDGISCLPESQVQPR